MCNVRQNVAILEAIEHNGLDIGARLGYLGNLVCGLDKPFVDSLDASKVM